MVYHGNGESLSTPVPLDRHQIAHRMTRSKCPSHGLGDGCVDYPRTQPPPHRDLRRLDRVENLELRMVIVTC